jgi:hypothetical protein
MRSAPFTRPTLSAAVELLEQHSQARFNQVVLRLGLEDEIPSDTGVSVAKKCDLLRTHCRAARRCESSTRWTVA